MVLGCKRVANMISAARALDQNLLLPQAGGSASRTDQNVHFMLDVSRRFNNSPLARHLVNMVFAVQNHNMEKHLPVE